MLRLIKGSDLLTIEELLEIYHRYLCFFRVSAVAAQLSIPFSSILEHTFTIWVYGVSARVVLIRYIVLGMLQNYCLKLTLTTN